MKQRATQLAVDDVRLLDHWCRNLGAMFAGHVSTILHVGSSLEHGGYRDVDIRVVLPDADIEALPLNRLDLNMLLSRWGQEQTGLPIDCQVQSVTESRYAQSTGSAPIARERNWRAP